MTDDFTLLDAWARGDRDAAESLFGRHFDAVYRFFASKVSTGIEDLVQDTFAATVSARDRIRRDSTFRAFLFGIARNLLFAHYRRRQRDERLVDLGDSSVADLEPTPSAVLVDRDEARIVLEALRRIRLDHQIALELYEWEGLSGPEVADALGITEPAFRSRLHRAKLELRDQIEKICSSREALESTLGDLDGWARALRERLGR